MQLFRKKNDAARKPRALSSLRSSAAYEILINTGYQSDLACDRKAGYLRSDLQVPSRPCNLESNPDEGES